MPLQERMKLEELAKEAERWGLIGWRQCDRVRKGQSVNIEGRNVMPEELLELIQEAKKNA